MKTWLVNIIGCGTSKEEAAKQVEVLLQTVIKGQEGKIYDRLVEKGCAVGKWAEGPEIQDVENLLFNIKP